MPVGGLFHSTCSLLRSGGEATRWPHGVGITEFRVEAIECPTHDKWLVSELVPHHAYWIPKCAGMTIPV